MLPLFFTCTVEQPLDSCHDKSGFVRVVYVYASRTYMYTINIYTTIAHHLRADVTLLPAAPVTSRTPVKCARNSRDATSAGDVL